MFSCTRKIISIDTSIPDLKMAKVDFGGMVKNICIQWSEATIGDYILAHAGMAIATVDENGVGNISRL